MEKKFISFYALSKRKIGPEMHKFTPSYFFEKYRKMFRIFGLKKYYMNQIVSGQFRGQ